MKKQLLKIAGVFASALILATSVNAQTEVGVLPNPDKSDNNQVNVERGNTTVNDTNFYATFVNQVYNIDTTYIILSINSSNIYTWFHRIQTPSNVSVDIEGARMHVASGNADGSPVSVAVSLVETGANGLPSNNVLETKTVSINPVTTNNVGDFANDVVFDNSYSSSNGFYLQMTLDSNASDTLRVITGQNGAAGVSGDSISIAGFTGGNNLNTLGYVQHIRPFVSYEATNSITTDKDTITTDNESVSFTAEGNFKNIADPHLMTGISKNAFWSLDNGSTFVGPANDTTYSFADATIDHTVLLNDSIMTWSAGTYVVSESKTIVGDKTVTGINSIDEGNIKVYRSQNMLNVEVNGNLNPGNQDLFIYNVAGQLVKSSRVNLTANSTSRVNINELNDGLYIVKVADKTVRFVK